VALLICCTDRNTANVGDLYPASSNSSVRFVSFRIVIISACSWPSQRSCSFRKFYPLLRIVHLHSGSKHMVRPSVVMILVSFTRSFHTCADSRIRRNRLLESFGPGTNSFLSLVAFLALVAVLLTKEARVVCSCWHRGCVPLHVSMHELRTFLVN